MLYKNQKPIADNIYESLSKKELYNIPTGRGKTFILLDVARRCMKEGKKVIISSPNNNLARDMQKIAIKHFSMQKSSKIVISATNFISKSKLSFFEKERLLIEEYVTSDSFNDYLLYSSDQDNELFFDDFNRIVKYKDIAFSPIVSDMLSLDENEKNSFSDGLSITNHFYLLSKVVYDKNFCLKDYVLLVDEVHSISEIAEIILTDNFSTFEFSTELRKIKKELLSIDDFVGKTTLKKKLSELYVKSYRMHNKFTSDNFIGQYIQKNETVDEIIAASRQILSSKELEYLINKKDKFSSASQKIIKKYNIVSNSIYDISEENLKNFAGVYYSPSKGYPNVKFTRKNIIGQLNYNFWEKIGEFAGVSATVTSSFSPDDNEVMYGYSRLGMIQKDKKREYKIWFYDRLFPKENINIFLPKHNLAIKTESVFDEECDFDSPHYNYLVDYIYKTRKGKNSLVLCSGYKESEFLSTLYKKKYIDEDVMHANTKEKTTQTVESFREKGGVLFGTRNYNIGISLEGKELEVLYVLKFPFVNYTDKKWLDIANKSIGLYRTMANREMLITLMQTLGRLQRTKEDKGDIHILDQRYYKYKELRQKIDTILENYGNITKGTPIQPKRAPKKKIDIQEAFGF